MGWGLRFAPVSAPGDIFFVRQSGWTSFFIRFAQRVKYHKGNPCAQWNHVGMVVGTAGEIIEADPSGVARGNLTEYATTDMLLMRPWYQPAWEDSGLVHLDGSQAAVAAMEELLAEGTRYGFLSIFSVALALLTATKLRFGIDGTEICSGAVSYALTRANIDMGQDESFNTPADVSFIANQQYWTTVS